MHTIPCIVKSEAGKIERTAAQKQHGLTLGEQIAALIQANLTEIGATLVEGEPYNTKAGKTVVPYAIQGTINMPALTFDAGLGESQTYDWALNFRAAIPDPTGKAERPAAPVKIMRALTLAERLAERNVSHK